MQAERQEIAKRFRNVPEGSADYFFRIIEGEGGAAFQKSFGHVPGEGSYYFYGENIRRLIGIGPGTVPEKKLHEMVVEYSVPYKEMNCNPAILQSMVLKGSAEEYMVEMLVMVPGGEKKWIRETGFAMRDKDSTSVTGIIGVIDDISAQRKNLIGMDDSERIAEAFLRNISHEVRTPLNAIVGFSNLLCDPELAYGRQKEFAEMINQSTRHLLEIMDNIIEVSRIEAGEVQLAVSQVVPELILKNVYENLSSEAEAKGIRFSCRIPAACEGLAIESDEYKLTRIITQLAGNAIKFTLEGSVELGCKLKDGHFEFYVTDTGIGIRKEDYPGVFKKFFQAESGTTRRFPGTGLGLSISRAYAGLMGGYIDFTSRYGQGSTFRFVLPEAM